MERSGAFVPGAHARVTQQDRRPRTVDHVADGMWATGVEAVECRRHEIEAMTHALQPTAKRFRMRGQDRTAEQDRTQTDQRDRHGHGRDHATDDNKRPTHSNEKDPAHQQTSAAAALSLSHSLGSSGLTVQCALLNIG
jgi:hypothetical protein